jgi:two-component system chemotaxis response regulator CheY
VALHSVVVVDDSSLIRSRIARALADQRLTGFDLVGTAKNGIEAVLRVKQLHPSVVTLDITMPEMDGVACVGEMIKIHPEIRILIVSALADKATALKAIRNGAQGFLYKPFTVDELVEALTELVN